MCLAAGTLSNLVSHANTEVQQTLLPIIFAVLASALQSDVNSAMAAVSANLVGVSFCLETNFSILVVLHPDLRFYCFCGLHG